MKRGSSMMHLLMGFVLILSLFHKNINMALNSMSDLTQICVVFVLIGFIALLTTIEYVADTLASKK